MRPLAFPPLVAMAVVLAACGTRVTRIESSTPIDLSGYWNDTDSRLIAEEMIRDALARPWIELFVQERGRRPVLLFDGIENRTAEHIAQETFLNTFQRELLNSGRVGFVAAGLDRAQLRSEREDQQGNTSTDTRSAARQERGADFLLAGTIAYIEDAGRGEQLRVYQVDLRLHSLRDNSLAWAGQKVIRKVVNRPRARP